MLDGTRRNQKINRNRRSKRVSYKIVRIMLLCLTMFPPVATGIEFETTQRMARLKLFFDCNDSHPHFIKCVKNKNNCLPEEIAYLKLL